MLSNGHVTDDVTWPPKVLWGSTVGYPSDSLASCSDIVQALFSKLFHTIFPHDYCAILVLIGY